MNAGMLYETIKELCAERGINVSQLEKELHFGTGTIGKWSQSSPSIEKVMAVAEYFDISVDQLCGAKRKKAENTILQGIIRFTEDSTLKWVPCPLAELLHRSFSPAIENGQFEEVYFSEYKGGFLYLGKVIWDEDSILKLYIGMEDTPCILQEEEDRLLKILWEEIKEKEQAQRDKIEKYKKFFV